MTRDDGGSVYVVIQNIFSSRKVPHIFLHHANTYDKKQAPARYK